MIELLALDVTPPAADASAASFMLWVILVLMGALGTVIIFIVAKIKANELKCEKEQAECAETISGSHRKIEALYQGLIKDQQDAAAQKAILLVSVQKALERNSDSFDRNTDIIAVLGRSDHPKRNVLP